MYIKKKLFNWLGPLNNFFCLDIFSGSGALGIEAASKNCKFSVLLEKDKNIFLYLRKNLFKLNFKNIKLINCDFYKFLKINNLYIYDVIFFDSPYIKLKNLINFIVLSFKILKSGSIIYIETIFNLNFLFKNFFNKFKILKNEFFNKINFFLIEII